ncbi:MAG: RNA polymerase sigma factor [Planctomycetota bacterium]|nr:MAG: RNA polymerase sigma factor [Planctomycetota bacterium]
MQDRIVEIVSTAQRGDREAQRQLYVEYHQQVHRLMVRMVGVQEADDLTQQVFLQVFRKLGQFTGQSRFGTWLYRVAINESLQHLRRSGRRQTRTLAEDPADGRSHARDKLEQRELLDRALERLDPELRLIFLLRESEGWGYREIARTMKIPEGTVGSRLNRARRELRRYLEELGWEP